MARDGGDGCGNETGGGYPALRRHLPSDIEPVPAGFDAWLRTRVGGGGSTITADPRPNPTLYSITRSNFDMFWYGLARIWRFSVAETELRNASPGVGERLSVGTSRQHMLRSAKTDGGRHSAGLTGPLSSGARRRGGKAKKRGASKEQVPVLVVADRAGTTVGAVFPAVDTGTLRKVFGPVVDQDIILVSDGHTAHPPCATAMGVRHAENGSGTRSTSRRSTAGTTTRALPAALPRCFHQISRHLSPMVPSRRAGESPPCAFLAAAIDRSCIGFEN